MRIKTLIVAGAGVLMAAMPAFGASNWEVRLNAAPQGPVQLGEVRLGDHLAANVHQIGQRDLDRLLEELRSDVEQRLSERGLLAAPGEAAVSLDLILVDARPNRPTFDQLAGRGDWNWDRPGGLRRTSSQLSLSSFGLGGATLVGEFTGADGAPLGEVSYRYEQTDIREAQFAATWTDAHRGIDIFSRRLAETIAP